MNDKIKVTIWNEYREDRNSELYPRGLHGFIKDFLDKHENLEVRLAALDDPDQGLPDSVLNNTDVLMWWGHSCHGEVDDALVAKIKKRVYEDGMGFIPIHSAHFSKPFCSIVGASGKLHWSDAQKEIIWNILPSHPITAGIPDHFIIENEEAFGEPFLIPQPDELLFVSWFEHGFVFRGGCTYYRGRGKVFYFQPGHDTCASFYNEYVQRILYNGILWAAPNDFGAPMYERTYHEPVA